MERFLQYGRSDLSSTDVANVPYPLLILDANTQILNWNQEAGLLFGFSGDGLAGKPYSLLFDDEERAKELPQALLMNIASGKVASLSCGFQRADGSTFRADAFVTPFLNAAMEDAKYLFLVKWDSPVQPAGEEDLWQLNMMNEAEEAAKVGSWVWDIKTDRFILSDSLCAVFHIPRNFTVNFRRFIQSVHPDYKYYVKRTVELVIANRVFEEFNFKVVTAGNRVKYVDCGGKLLYDEHGEVIGATGILKDITDKKNFVLRITDKNKKLLDISYKQSHLVRMHLANILGFCALFDNEDYLNPFNKTVVEGINAAALNLDRAIKEIVDLANPVDEP